MDTRKAVIEALTPLFTRPDFEAISFLLTDICKSRQRIRVLARLLEGEATANEVANDLDIHIATAYRSVRSLMKLGLVVGEGKQDNPWKRGGPDRGLFKFMVSEAVPPGEIYLIPEDPYDLQGKLKEKEIGIIKGVE